MRINIVDHKKFSTFLGFLLAKYKLGGRHKFYPLKPSLMFIVPLPFMWQAPYVPEVCFSFVGIFNVIFVLSAFFSFYSVLEVDRDVLSVKFLNWTVQKIPIDSIAECTKMDWLLETYRLVHPGTFPRMTLVYRTDFCQALDEVLK